MEQRHGNLSINSENIFPIIKKWMYSDQDIFIRELISNASDAITKRKQLDAIGEVALPEGYRPKVEVLVNDKEQTLKFIDNGIGMTDQEVIRNITEIAFSGVVEFMEKYKDKADTDQIIGHFGLGFYSAFMVSDLVEIDTLSFQEGAEPVHWECEGSTEYDMRAGDKKEPGTIVTLHINEDSLEYANEYKVREILEKYCSFMPVEIFLSREGAEPQTEIIDEKDLREDDIVVERIHTDAKTEEKVNDKGEKETVEVSPARDEVKIQKRPVSISDSHPLWTKQPSATTDEEYKEFYRHVFLDYKEPLFWIHLNMDYPFNLKGILYFPRITNEYESIEGKIKLYNNQVFIADNIREVIPEYMMLLKGVIDCPDLPLNVSRSALQNDGFVQKISNYISKKISDKLSGMFKTKREDYEKYWDDISPFIKYGTLKDEKFSDRMMPYILFKDIEGKYRTLEELKKTKQETAVPAEEASAPTEKAEASAEEVADKAEDASAPAEEMADTAEEKQREDSAEPEKKEPQTIFYVTDEVQQSQYIRMFRAQGMNAVLMKHTIDAPFITHVEQKDEKLHFQRIDAEIHAELKAKDAKTLEEETRLLQELFRKALKNDRLTVRAEDLKDGQISSMVTLSEESRRMSDMMKMYGMGDSDNGMFDAQATLILNINHPLVTYLLDHAPKAEAEKSEKADIASDSETLTDSADGQTRKASESVKTSETGEASGNSGTDEAANASEKDHTDEVLDERLQMISEQLYDLAMLSNRPLKPAEMTRFVARTNQLMEMLVRIS